MRRFSFKSVVWVAAGTILVLSGFAGNLNAGTPHAAYGKAQYSGGGYPASLTFSAYVTSRSADVLTQSSAGCTYDAGTGSWLVQCGSFSSAWAAGDVLHVDFNDGAGGTGSDEVTLTSNPADDGGTTVLTSPVVSRQITVKCTTGTGAVLQITVDGASYSSPQTFTWTQGSSHTISVSSPQSGGTGIQGVFTGWSDGGGQSHSYTVPSSDQTVVAYFKTQYELKVQSDHGSPTGAGWYDAGSTATFGISTPESGGTGIQYVFTGWTGSGSGSYTGTNTSKSVSMTNAITETASWKTQYKLFASENPDAGGNMTPAPSGAWYDSGASATIDATVNSGYTWSGWTGDVTGTDKPKTVTMNASKSVTANFTASTSTVQITLGTNPTGREFIVDGTAYSTTQVFTWTPGSTHNLNLNTPQSGATGTRYAFYGWSDLGALNHTYTVPSSNETVTASFKTQYELKVQSDHGSPTGAGWYDAGSTATFGISTPESGGTGIQYVFTGWTGSGSGSFTGPNASKSVTMTNAITETAAWKTQYKLYMSESPDAGGNASPAPPGAWYDSGASVTLDATVATGYIWSGWTGDVTGTDKPKTLTMNASKSVTANFSAVSTITIKVMVEPSGKQFSVDGTLYSDFQYFNWVPGSTHSLSVESPQHVSGGSKWVFVNWSNGGAQSHTYTVPSASEIVKATFKCMVQLTTAENPDAGGNMTPAPPGGWYDSGASVTLDATVATGYTWSGWTGDVTATEKPKTITMGGPKNITANFASGTAVPIKVMVEPSGKQFSVDGTQYSDFQYFNWIPGTTHTISAESPQHVSDGSKWVFVNWSDGGAQSHAFTVPSSSVIVKATFKNMVQLTVNSERGNPQGSGWYDAGATAAFSVTAPIDGGSVRYWFIHWSGDCSGTNPSASVVMGGPKTVTANWKPQYNLKVVSLHGNPKGEGWYDAGAAAAFSVTTPVTEGNTRQIFDYWTGSAAGTSPSGTITMNESKTVQAIWHTQHFLATAVSPVSAGTVIPAPPGAWYNEGDSAAVSVKPKTGYLWDGWAGDLSGKKNPDTLFMNGPKAIKAFLGTTSFYRVTTDPPGLAIRVDGSEYVSPCDFPWAVGTQHTIGMDSLVTGGAGTRHLFKSWSDGKPRSHQVTADNITMTYMAATETQYYLTTAASPDTGGSPIPAPPGTWAKKGTVLTLYAIPNILKGYAFAGWSGSHSGKVNPDTLVVNSARQVTANFSVQTFAFTIQLDPPDGGSVIKSPEKSGYSLGEMVQLKAVAAGGYVFDSWAVGASGSANPAIVWVTDNNTVLVRFKKTSTSVDDQTQKTNEPSGFALDQNYPNPFNPETSIRFSLPETGRVRLTIYNTLGEAVRTLVNEIRQPGTYKVAWNGRSDKGHDVSAGTYLVVLQSGDRVQKMKAVFMK